LSHRQIGALKWIDSFNVKVEHLRSAHATTLWSLLHWKYIARVDDAIVLTKLGQEELRTYEQSTVPERKVEADLTERCQRLLKLSKARASASSVA
jgi:hypothetical protein